MNRYLTVEEFKDTEEGELLYNIYRLFSKAVEKGLLKDCEVILPVVTDEPPLDTINDILNTDADCMYYIPILGTENNFLEETRVIKELLLPISNDIEGVIFSDDKTLIHINSMSFKDEDQYHHNILFLVKGEEKLGTDLVS